MWSEKFPKKLPTSSSSSAAAAASAPKITGKVPNRKPISEFPVHPLRTESWLQKGWQDWP